MLPVKCKIESDKYCSKKDSSAFKIQKFIRNYLGRRKAVHQLRSEIDSILTTCEKEFLPATEIFFTGQKLLFVFDVEKDKKRFISYCRTIVAGMEAEDLKVWYVTLALSKVFAVAWIKQMKKLFAMACTLMKTVKLQYPEDNYAADCYLSLIAMFCDYTLWKFTKQAGSSIQATLHQLCVMFVSHIMDQGFYPIMNVILIDGLCCEESKLSRRSLPAAIGVRLLALQGFSQHMMMLFVRYILSVPASILHLQSSSPEVIRQLNRIDFLSRIIAVMSTMKSSITGLGCTETVSIMCNVLYLASLSENILGQRKELVILMLELLPGCRGMGSHAKGNTSFWHPLLGWCRGHMDIRVLQSYIHVRKQLQCLWQPQFVEGFFSDLLDLNCGSEGSSIKKDVESETIITSVCEMYLGILSTMSNLSSDLLIGLGCNQALVYSMWCFFRQRSKLKIRKIIAAKRNLNIISLFSQMMLYMLVILDDHDLFKKQDIFSSSDFAEITIFLNNFFFYVVWQEEDLSLTPHCQSLLTMLYNRDCKQHFCSDNDWLIKDIKISVLMKEVESKTQRGVNILLKLPHVIPHIKRVEIFHGRLQEEKQRLGLASTSGHAGPTTYISINRQRILEDGFQQMRQLSALCLKGTIRVKFVNLQGLDEAGIDETGVFKEFLEEALKLAFNPDFNLFKSNVQGHIFPSSSSHLQENYLELFEFIGKMLGKALYEGIVVDVPFAPFFLSHMLQRNHSTYYNYFDELSSFDQQMYSSLNFIKHYDGDVEDLCLTFSWDEDFMGKIITHELVEGGCGIPVTASNRLSYVHRMALFRLSTQVKKQTDAFIKGFHFLIDPLLIQCFSSQELQKLISGDQSDIDVDDLRKHTEYLGGYHGHHKSILWLWDILKKDFSPTERGQFLKFVTSCSRPPLLGFKHLNPPFTVRYVQVSSTEDTDDSLAGMFKGLLRRHQSKDRLPSASTCFNLLKLPNYSKKTVLREKLKYAIQANCGFELS